jgi:hypothetical protein
VISETERLRRCVEDADRCLARLKKGQNGKLVAQAILDARAFLSLGLNP